MNRFERFMNCTGKKVMHLFFLLATLLSCKPCAAYFFLKEQNFECPICKIVKGVKTSASCIVISSVELSITAYDNIKNGSEKVIAKGSEVGKKINSFFAKLNSRWWLTDAIVVNVKKINHCEIRAIRFTKVPLYLFFRQLKIGDVFYFSA